METQERRFRGFQWFISFCSLGLITAALYGVHLTLLTYYTAYQQDLIIAALENSPIAALQSSKFLPFFPSKTPEWKQLSKLLNAINVKEYSRARQIFENSTSNAFTESQQKKIAENMHRIEYLKREISSKQSQIEQDETNAMSLLPETTNFQVEIQNNANEVSDILIHNLIERVRASIPSTSYYLYQLARDGARAINSELPNPRVDVVPSAPSWYDPASKYVPSIVQFVKNIIS